MKTRLELYDLFEKHKNTGVGVEVGVLHGHNAKNILDRYSGHLILVDIWENIEDFYICKEYIKDYLHRVSFFRMSSKQAAFLFNSTSFDFVYIDAGHEYEDIKNDFLSWFWKIMDDGIISGHDYSPVFPGVVKFVDILKHNNDVRFTKGDEYEGVNYESWYYIK